MITPETANRENFPKLAVTRIKWKANKRKDLTFFVLTRLGLFEGLEDLVPLGLLPVDGEDVGALEQPREDEGEVLYLGARREEQHDLLALGLVEVLPEEADEGGELAVGLAHHVEVVEGGGGGGVGGVGVVLLLHGDEDGVAHPCSDELLHVLRAREGTNIAKWFLPLLVSFPVSFEI